MRKELPFNLQFFAESAETDAAETDAAEAAGKGGGQEKAKEPAAGGASSGEEPASEENKGADLAQLVAEEVKKASMSEEERKAYDAEQREKTLQAREEAIAMRELKADARALLAENSLPESFLGMVLGRDRADTQARVKALKDGFDGAVQKQVGERLKGRTPSTGTGRSGRSEAETLQAEVESYL